MADLSEIMGKLQSAYGDEVGAMGGFWETAERIPTGIFPLDLAIGGGIPRQRVTEVYGPEGSCKTNICINTIRSNQLIRPEEKAVVFDMEGVFDPNWATVMGVDMSRVAVIRPDYTEQLADMMEEVVNAKDVGVVVLDSLAHCMATAVGEASAEKQFMGNDAKAIRRMAVKLNIQMKRMRQGEVLSNGKKSEREPPAVIWINQVTSKVGVIMGNPETTPGGHMPRFLYSLRLRVSGKPVMDEKISKMLPVARTISCSVKKFKVPVTCLHSEFDLIMLPHKGFRPGDCDDWNLIEAHAKENGLLRKGPKDKGWVMGKQTYNTLAEIKKRYVSEPDFMLGLRGAVSQTAMEKTGFLSEMSAEEAIAADSQPLEEEFDYDKETGEIIEKPVEPKPDKKAKKAA